MATAWRAWVLTTVLSATSGCSLLFQQRLSSKADPTVEPQCNDSTAWPSIDAIFTVAALIGIVYIVATGQPDREIRVGVGAAELILFGSSGGLGGSWAARCKRARKTWDQSEEERREREAAERDQAASLERRRAAQPHGFSCTTSPSTHAAGFCTRDPLGCEQARTVVLGTVDDLTPCVAVAVAFCFDETHCAPTAGVCELQRPSENVACKETK